MKYRIRISYDEKDPRKWQLQTWDRGQWSFDSLHDTREAASIWARNRYPEAELFVDPELIRGVEEANDE